ncbi:phage integrase SAM-like domain-containing protein [Empedobacter brevis]
MQLIINNIANLLKFSIAFLIMITAEIILDTRRKTKKGYPVKIRIYDTNLQKHEYVGLKIYQDSEHLISDNLIKQRDYKLVKELEFITSKNLDLKESIEIIKNGIPLNDIEKRILELESELARLKGQVNPAMLFEFTEKYILEKKNREEQVRLFTSLLKKLKSFIHPLEDMPINDIKIEFLMDFQSYLSQSLKNQSVNTYMSKFQTVFYEAQKREDLNIKHFNPFKNLKKLIVNNDEDKSISIDSLKKLMTYDFDDWKYIQIENYKRTIDLFLFQLAIGGHDLVDITLLKWSNIKDGRITFKRYKNRKLSNGGPTIDNKLFDFALNVIDKHGTKNDERIFSFIPFPTYDNEFLEYRIYLQHYNRRLAAIREKLCLPETIISKRSRYTFNTIAGNLLINRDIIEELQGHSQSSISHGYYGGTFNEIKDAEHFKIIEAVFGE